MSCFAAELADRIAVGLGVAEKRRRTTMFSEASVSMRRLDKVPVGNQLISRPSITEGRVLALPVPR